MDDVEIEVFRADTKASRGITSSMLADVAAFDCNAHPVPNVLGHPKSDSPAHGAIKKFRVEGASLFATVPAAAKAIWDGIKGGTILNRSMAFFDPNHEANPTPGKLAPRHLGWLGGAAPGIPGMSPLSKALSFAADDLETLVIDGAPADAVIFAATPTPVLTISEPPETKEFSVTPEQIEAERLAKIAAHDADVAKLAADRLAFEAEQATARRASSDLIVDGLVTAGKVLPAEAPGLKLVFSAFSPEPLEFAADRKVSPAVELGRILSSLPKRIPIGERISPTGEFAASTDGDDDGATIVAKARADMAKTPGLTFEAACSKYDAAAA